MNSNPILELSIHQPTFISYTLLPEEDVSEFLKEAVSIPYLQKLDASDALKENEISHSVVHLHKNKESHGKWNQVKASIDPILMNVVTQMIQLGPKLGFFFKGFEAENVDNMMDTMKSHLKNFKAEKGKFI